MRLQIDTTRNTADRALKRKVDQSVRIGLGRHAGSIEQTHVQLSSCVEADGTVLRTSRLRAFLKDGSRFVAESRSPHWSTAASTAAQQLAHRLERHQQARRLLGPRLAPMPGRLASGDRSR